MVEEERIKSALEIAMERISALPELTPEDIAEQKEKQYGPVGEAMAGRYLSGAITEDELSGELNKHTDQRQIVCFGAVSALCRSLRLDEDPEITARALRGLDRIALGKTSLIEKAGEEFRAVLREFELEIRTQLQGIESLVLEPLGISGSAVRCNPAVNEPWLEKLGKIRQSHEPRLEKLRAGLLRELRATGR
jgi:hypothetical protein